MSSRRTVREPPRIVLHAEASHAPRAHDDHGFLRVTRHRLTATYPGVDGASPVFPYDAIERTNLDAVAVIPHYAAADGEHVLLRSCVRPPLALRPIAYVDEVSLPSWIALGSQWEIPAGLVEVDERTVAGLRACAARELHEELGFKVDLTQVVPLGGAVAPAAGMIGELIYLFSCRLDSPVPGDAPGDGSPLEVGGAMLDLSLEALIAACDEGEIVDAKTELAGRRLLARLARTQERA